MDTDDGTDLIESAVRAAVEAVQSGKQGRIAQAYEALATLETGDVIAELFLWVDDLVGERETTDVDVRLPPNGHDVLDAVKARDLTALQQAVNSDQVEKVLTNLLLIIAAMKDAREADAGRPHRGNQR